MRFCTVFFSTVFLSSGAQAGSSQTQVVDFFSLLAEVFYIDPKYVPAVASFFSVSVVLLVGVVFRRHVLKATATEEVAPGEQFALATLADSVMAFLYDLTKEQCGVQYKRFLNLLSGIFLFIFVSNLFGLVPGFPPATGSFSLNLAVGLLVFLYYNGVGVQEHGFAYVKQFTGPFLILAPMFFVLELVSHLARPLSLSFRLTANIFGDHLLLGVFGDMVPLVVPALFLFFGLLVACLQSFVFTLLTSIYINMAISHDH